MTRSRILILSVALSLLIITPLFCGESWAEPAVDPPKVSIQKLSGDVQIFMAGGVDGRAAAEGDVLGPKDKIQTGKNASAKIVVEGAGEINLSKETTWSFEKYSVENGKRDFSAHLALGRLKAKVQKLPEGSVFQVRTPTSVAAVRGTVFGLFVYMVEQQFFTMLEVFEESVAFSNLSGEQTMTVDEGQMAAGNEAGDVTPPQTAGTETDKALGEEKLEESAFSTSTPTTQPDQASSGDAEDTSAKKKGEVTPTEPYDQDLSAAGFSSEDIFQPPETIQESKPGQPELEQETQGAQETVTGSTEPEVKAKVESQYQGSG